MKKLNHILYFIRWWFNEWCGDLDKPFFAFKVAFWSIISGLLVVALFKSVIGVLLFIFGVCTILLIFIQVTVINEIKIKYAKFKREQLKILNQLK